MKLKKKDRKIYFKCHAGSCTHLTLNGWYCKTCSQLIFGGKRW